MGRQVFDLSHTQLAQEVEVREGEESRRTRVTCSGPMDGDWVSAKWFINGNALDSLSSFSEVTGVSLVH